ncbi:MAG: leucine--tRNA ligase [Clostridiales bacterium]|nr:leucine--tRNA ligase [Clostridiales bacterium]
MSYDFKNIEKKWRDYWEKENLNKNDFKNSDKKKFYCLDMFPYPSSSGIHVGHWRGYVISDVLSRYKIMQGYEIIHPMGWDAFGLPTENYAIKMSKHPSKITLENILNLKRQIKEISAVYNWDCEINTTDPDYYKWTQWIFIKMFENNLAYEKEMLLNWCPNCKCVLANEESTSGICDRCGNEVTKKKLRQWMLKITNYAERLLNDLDLLDWPEKVKKMQRDWIGKSHGVEVNFVLENNNNKFIKIFTTRCETLYGATFLVLAPEYKNIDLLVTDEYKDRVKKYIFESNNKSIVDRMINKNKTGIFTGSYAINPLNNKKIPIWISDYVLIDYGTGAIMCVPAHDERDNEFAKKFDLEIVKVIDDKNNLINSCEFNNLNFLDARKKILGKLEKENFGKQIINYKLRDWIFSRQRYWGEPIPIVHCDQCGLVTVSENDLPVLLPDIDKYKPTDNGESPLARIDDWINTKCPKCGKNAKRETNTMPQWAGSSWYFLRYIDNKNDKEIANKNLLKKFLPVDYYIGGVEHAVLHLLYARFYTKFLYDINVIDFQEPFLKLFNQGMITKNKSKMSKSKGNVVSPDELIEKYGCDSLRMYVLFIGPAELDCEWDNSGIDGVFRFLNRLYSFIFKFKDKLIKENDELLSWKNKFIFEITRRIEKLSLNTVVSGFMESLNSLIKISSDLNGVDKKSLETFAILIAPFAPHLAEEFWFMLNNNKSIFKNDYPKFDKKYLNNAKINIAVQVNGKFKSNLSVDFNITEFEIISMAKKILGTKISEDKVLKIISVPKKVVNFVLKK